MLTPKLILVIACLLLVGTAGLGFANKQKDARKTVTLAERDSTIQTKTTEATTAKAGQKKAEKEAEESAAKSASLETDLATSKRNADDLNTKVTAADEKIKSNEASIADLTEKNRLLAVTAKPTGPDPETTQKLEALTRENAELKVVKEGLDTQLASARSQTAALQQRQAARDSGERMVGLRGQVLAVDRNWNFVVLNLGGRNGVNNNATLVVQRGGSMVGRLRITSVEPSQSVADIIPNTVPAGVAVQPGDVVVFSGS